MERRKRKTSRKETPYTGKVAYMRQFPNYDDIPDKKSQFFDEQGRIYKTIGEGLISYKIPIRLGGKISPPESGDNLRMIRTTDFKTFSFRVEYVENLKIDSKSGTVTGDWGSELPTNYEIVNALLNKDFYRKLRL